jgi:hypothetical protein
MSKHDDHATDCTIHIGYGICNCGCILRPKKQKRPMTIEEMEQADERRNDR